MVFNLMLLVYLQIVTTRKQRQSRIENSHENSRQVKHNYYVDNLVYIYTTVIYHKPYMKIIGYLHCVRRGNGNLP